MMIVELLDLSSVRGLLCWWLVVVGEFGWTLMLSTAILSALATWRCEKH